MLSNQLEFNLPCKTQCSIIGCFMHTHYIDEYVVKLYSCSSHSFNPYFAEIIYLFVLRVSSFFACSVLIFQVPLSIMSTFLTMY